MLEQLYLASCLGNCRVGGVVGYLLLTQFCLCRCNLFRNSLSFIITAVTRDRQLLVCFLEDLKLLLPWNPIRCVRPRFDLFFAPVRQCGCDLFREGLSFIVRQTIGTCLRQLRRRQVFCLSPHLYAHCLKAGGQGCILCMKLGKLRSDLCALLNE